MMVVLTCPNCSARLEYNDSQHVAFCQYCGTRIANVPQRVNVTYDRRAEIQNLLLRANEFALRGDYARAAEYCGRVLDIDPGNTEARAIEHRLPNYRPAPNVFILYRSSLDQKYRLRITTDGAHWYELSNGQQISLYLPAGTHRILFSGTKTYQRSIAIPGNGRPVSIVYTAGRRNAISIT